jgi:enoyl-CoA hydratase/carnithine racemase
MSELVMLSTITNGIATLTLNRPEKKNSLSIALREEISDTLQRLSADEDLRVLIITGAGDTFCAGFDLDEFRDTRPEFQERLWQSSDHFHHSVLRFPLPTVAGVNGAALAGGFDLATVCDLRLASCTARFAHPEQRFGDVMYAPLRELIGGAAARDLCLTGRSIDADEALRLGLVSAVVSPSALPEELARTAAVIAQAPRRNLLRMKAKIITGTAIPATRQTLDI